jgi:hypothetical protein
VLLIYIALISLSVLLYTFISGLVLTWLHNYLLNTSKISDYYHDHRMCLAASLFWPLPLLGLTTINMFKMVKFIYHYPNVIYIDVQSRKKKLQKENK